MHNTNSMIKYLISNTNIFINVQLISHQIIYISTIINLKCINQHKSVLRIICKLSSFEMVTSNVKKK